MAEPQPNETKSKVIMYCIFGAIVFSTIVGLLLLQLIRPDASAVFIDKASGLVTTALLAGGTFYGLRQVQKQTNGNLSRRDEKIAEQHEEIVKLSAENAAKDTIIAALVVTGKEKDKTNG